MQNRRSIARTGAKPSSKRSRTQQQRQRLKSIRRKGTKTYRYVIPAMERSEHSPLLSVIIPAMNEEKTIGKVVRFARRICRNSEVIVVVNGSTDGTARAARAAGARVISYTEALGHDGGRRAGAMVARGNVLLFTDADIPISPDQLAPYVQAIMDGTDVALNDYNGPITRNPIHPVVEAKHVLNSMLTRPDLQGASMTAIPHAISRKALEVIGAGCLEIPPLAQAKAVVGGLQVRAVHHVPVGRMNAVRLRKRRSADLLSQVILTDHLTAIKWITDTLGSRGGHSDLERVRSLAR
ncbi:glycosyltransferase [Paenibacillus sp. MER 99-2]|uniref:glycosyltransferase family 2 protein n=1 Tax=Paenibacillus sp. MER 99-2 TaxID=2939572 RepID=UPI00203BE4A9|nr:glycosyltransferase [Paenibacillus sp. MER 99-2]MCM3175093.1 glycosyltransferase [Paenibacillus sp. MER 99-2]